MINMVYPFRHDGRLSRISSSLSSQHHSSFVLANSSFDPVVGCHKSVDWFVECLYYCFATNLLTESAASQVQPCSARSNSYLPALGQVVDSQQYFVGLYGSNSLRRLLSNRRLC